MKDDVTRDQVIARVRRQLAEVNQIFWDADHWNRAVRKADEEPIDPDPDGELARIKAGLEGLLRNEIRICEPKHRG